jgi:hypothetical protein
MTALTLKFNKLVQAGLFTANLVHEFWIALLFVRAFTSGYFFRVLVYNAWIMPFEQAIKC